MPVEHILIVGTEGQGGVNQYTTEQQRHLPAELDVEFYAMNTQLLGSGIGWFLRSLFRSLFGAIRFPFRSRPEVVHVHTSHGYSFVRAAYYVLVARYLWIRPVVLHIHGSSFDAFVEQDGWLLGWLKRITFRASDAVIVLSPYWRETLAGSVAPSKLHVVPNAVVPDEYSSDPGAEPAHVVFLSTLIPRKGVETFADAIELVLDRPSVDVEVTIAGDGPLAETAEDLADRRDAVTYRGYVAEAEKRRLLGAGSIYVLPTHAEGLPIAILEAMAGGNAIVSTGVGAIPGVVESEGGLLVEPGNVEGLAAALIELAHDPSRVAAMGRHNRTLIEDRYAWDRTIDQLLSIYETVADTASADETSGPRATRETRGESVR